MNSVLIKYVESEKYRFFDFEIGRWTTDQLSRSAAIKYLVSDQELTLKMAKQALDNFDWGARMCESIIMAMPQSFMPSVRKDSST